MTGYALCAIAKSHMRSGELERALKAIQAVRRIADATVLLGESHQHSAARETLNMLPNLEDRIQAVETALPPDDDCHTQAHNHRAMAAVPVSLVASGSSGNVRFNSHSRYIIGDLRCNAGCSIYRIVRALGLRLDDLAARPQTMTPDFESMDASERRAYDAADRVRRSRHKVASEHFRRCRREVARVKREIEAVTARRSSRDGGTTGSEPHDDRTAGNEPCKDCADGISSGDAARDDAANDHPPCDGAHGSKPVKTRPETIHPETTRPATPVRKETAPRAESRPVVHTEAAPRTERRSAPTPRTESSRSAPAEHAAPASKPRSHPAPAAKPVPAPKPESRPASKPEDKKPGL